MLIILLELQRLFHQYMHHGRTLIKHQRMQQLFVNLRNKEHIHLSHWISSHPSHTPIDIRSISKFNLLQPFVLVLWNRPEVVEILQIRALNSVVLAKFLQHFLVIIKEQLSEHFHSSHCGDDGHQVQVDIKLFNSFLE
jgi:hypothetical protein